ncbi:MAG: hypothetical protein R3B51_07855 [Thermodesulfobacteriota bacterium]
MPGSKKYFESKAVRVRAKVFGLALLFLFVTGAKADPIRKNEVEDLNIIISQVVGGEPNVLLIADYSGSMVRNWAEKQVGNWDGTDNSGTIGDCEELYSTSSSEGRRMAAHCSENVAGVSVCGSRHAGGSGVVSNQQELLDFVACIQNPPGGGPPGLTNTQISTVYDQLCGNNNGYLGETIFDCSGNEYAEAAAAMDAWAGFTQCSSVNCNASGGTSRACDTSTEYGNFKDCMKAVQAITVNKTQNCANSGEANCSGEPRYGSSRVDMLHSVLFDFLDADDSLADKMCDDPSKLFDGASTSISCKDFMATTFRVVRQIARDDGSPSSNRRLPITGSNNTKLNDELTDDDREELGIGIRPLTYSGVGHWPNSGNGCTSQSTFRLAQGGFAGTSDSHPQGIWDFYRRELAFGGTPLAWVLGLDDRNNGGNQGGNVINDDVLGAFKVELQTDPSIECRPEFVIVITDGEDTCAGDPNGQNGQTSGSLTTNANRRSSIQAVSNVRTFYSRNPVQNRGAKLQEGNTYVRDWDWYTRSRCEKDPGSNGSPGARTRRA